MRRLYLAIIAVTSMLLVCCVHWVGADPAGEQRGSHKHTRTDAEIASQGKALSKDTTNVLRRAEAALVALDAEVLVSLYADDFLFEDTAFGLRITDKTELRSYFDRLFSSPDVSFSDASYFGLGTRAAGQWTWSGRSMSSGEEFSIRGASLFRIEGNKISEEIIFYDPRSAGY